MPFRHLLLSLAIGIAFAPPVQAAVRAYAGAVAGNAQGGIGPFGCATSGPTIGDGWFAGISLPTEGFAACNLAGGIDDKTAASGPLSSSQSAVGPSADVGTVTVSAQARADYWRLGVAASGSNTGTTATSNYHQAAAFASFTDTLTLSNPGIATGTAGFTNFGFLIEGAMNSLSAFSQQGDVSLGIRVNGQFIWTSFAATVLGTGVPFVRGGSTGLPGGFMLGAGTLSGSALVNSTANFNIQWGVPFTVEVALLASVYPCCNGASLSADFLNTAVLRSIDAYGPNGAVTNFSVTAASGVLLGPQGLLPVPEAGTRALALPGIAVLVASVSRRRRRALPGRPAASRDR